MPGAGQAGNSFYFRHFFFLGLTHRWTSILAVTFLRNSLQALHCKNCCIFRQEFMVSSRRNRFCSCKGEVLVLAQTIKAAQEKTCFEILFLFSCEMVQPLLICKGQAVCRGAEGGFDHLERESLDCMTCSAMCQGDLWMGTLCRLLLIKKKGKMKVNGDF